MSDAETSLESRLRCMVEPDFANVIGVGVDVVDIERFQRLWANHGG